MHPPNGGCRMANVELDSARAATASTAATSVRDRAGLASALASLLDELDVRERDASRHACQVAGLSVQIARGLGLPAARVKHVRLGALLHDVGKLAVPAPILAKTEPLTDGEWALMRRHPAAGEDLLTPLLTLGTLIPAACARDVLAIVRSHHERWDGSGYPDGLEADEIPLVARIVAVADAFEAMTECRPYSGARSYAGALAEVSYEADRQFDGRCVTSLLMVSNGRRV